jgi:hypothetical protein
VTESAETDEVTVALSSLPTKLAWSPVVHVTCVPEPSKAVFQFWSVAFQLWLLTGYQ